MKKSYYVDGHEHEDQKRHRSEFTNKYLTQLEARSHRWVQMSTDQAEIIKLSLPANDPLLSTGYIYSDPDTATHHVEFHVDDHDCLQDLANTKYGALGGNVSVRKAVDQKPLIIFGQDESIFGTMHRLRKRKITVGVCLRKSWRGGFDNHKVPR